MVCWVRVWCSFRSQRCWSWNNGWLVSCTPTYIHIHIIPVKYQSQSPQMHAKMSAARCYAQYCRIRKVFHKRPLLILVSTPHIIMYGDHKRSILFAVRKPFWQGICSVKLYSMLAYIYENNYMQLASCSSEVRASKAAVSKRKQNSARYQPGYFSLLPTANIVQWTKKLLIHDTNPLVTYPATYRSISLSQRGTITASVTPPVLSRFWRY